MSVGGRSISTTIRAGICLFYCCISSVSAEISSGFAIDTTSRDEVVSAWHRYYLASQDFADKWSGTESSDGCFLTAPSAGYTEDIQRRVNYFRAMAGLPANIDFSEKPIFRQHDDLFDPPTGTTRSEAARAAAMAHVNQPFNLSNPSSFTLTHDPSTAWPCFSSAAWNGARYSNLSGIFLGL